MRIKNAFKILLGNLNLMYKAIVYRFICTAVVGLIAYFAVYSGVKNILQNPQSIAFVESLQNMLRDFISGKGIASNTVADSFAEFSQMLATNASNIAVVGLENMLCLFVLRLLYGCGDYAFAKLYDGFMSSMTDRGFIATYFSEFGRAMLYSLIYSSISLVCEIVVYTVAVYIVVYGLNVISVFSIFLSLAFLVFSMSMKYTLLSRFLPNMVCAGLKTGKAFVGTMPKRKNFTALLSSFALLIVVFFYINVSFGIFTLYTGLILSLPITSLYVICVELVDYYTVKGRSYYIDYNNVYSPKEKDENAEMLKYL